MHALARLACLALCGLLLTLPRAFAFAEVSVADYPDVHSAIAANPGKRIYVPNGDHLVSKTIDIATTGTGLWGPGRIVMTNPLGHIFYIHDCADVSLQGISITRELEDNDRIWPTQLNSVKDCGVRVDRTTDLLLEGLRIIDNRSPGGAIKIEYSTRPTIRGCIVKNYKGVTIDDRTNKPEMGYAFRCVDGTAIKAFWCTGVQIIGNRLIEERWLPTQAIKEKFNLGEVTVLPETPGPLTPMDIFETRYTNNWHQGSGLIVGGLGKSSYNLIAQNYIENAAQGMDVHSDYVVISNNIVNNATMGMKAMHGSKHVLISANQFTKCSSYGILLCPGAASHEARPTSGTTPAEGPNIDGGTVVNGNIISDFGMGTDFWNVADSTNVAALNAISLQGEQLPHNPPLRDVIISNNMVYDDGRDQVLVDGELKVIEPRFRYALYVETKAKASPRGVRIDGNLFHAGNKGVSNVPIPPQE